MLIHRQGKKVTMKRWLASIGIVMAMFFGGVAVANGAPDHEVPPPPETDFRVGDEVNGGRVIEVSGDEIVIEFTDPTLPR